MIDYFKGSLGNWLCRSYHLKPDLGSIAGNAGWIRRVQHYSEVPGSSAGR